MIRKFRQEDLAEVMRIWLEGNRKAHAFIPESHWHGHYDEVAGLMIQAEVYVYEKENRVLGFTGLMGDTVAGIFVDSAARSNGIGKQLLDHVKQKKNRVVLQAYQKNERAVRFYLREQFERRRIQTDEESGETEYVMVWEKSPAKKG